jgi:hypothetical protein
MEAQLKPGRFRRLLRLRKHESRLTRFTSWLDAASETFKVRLAIIHFPRRLNALWLQIGSTTRVELVVENIQADVSSTASVLEQTNEAVEKIQADLSSTAALANVLEQTNVSAAYIHSGILLIWMPRRSTFAARSKSYGPSFYLAFPQYLLCTERVCVCTAPTLLMCNSTKYDPGRGRVGARCPKCFFLLLFCLSICWGITCTYTPDSSILLAFRSYALELPLY